MGDEEEDEYPPVIHVSSEEFAKYIVDQASPPLIKTIRIPKNYSEEDIKLRQMSGLTLGLIFSALALAGLVANLVVIGYIFGKRLYKNFVSSHFIAHLCFANLMAFILLLPVFLFNLTTDGDIWRGSDMLCRLQAFVTCAIWTVMHFMITCVAGVHLLTFARIHYDQLFGLPPTMLCCLSWVIGGALALPCITNSAIVQFNTEMHYCIIDNSDSGLKFLTYMLILGFVIPTCLTWYAYARVLGILYHSPIVFQALGLYKSRFLVYAFIISPLYQVPFYVFSLSSLATSETNWPSVVMFSAHLQCLVSPVFYGFSLFLMKEEDMALTARSHKATYQHPMVPPQEL